MHSEYYTVKQIAEKLQCSVNTVRFWVRTGKLPAVYLNGNKNIRVSGDDLDAFLAERKKGEEDNGKGTRGLPGTA